MTTGLSGEDFVNIEQFKNYNFRTMKRHILGSMAFCLFFFLPVSAQTGRETGTKWGKDQDSIEAVRTYSIYRSNLNNGNLQEALPLWRKVFRMAPRGHKNIVVDGPKMYTQLIAQEQDPVKKSALVDTLFSIYQERIELYPMDEALVKNYLVYALRDYRENNTDNMKKVLEYMGFFLKNAPDDAIPQDYSIYYSTMVELYKTGDETAENLLNGYEFMNESIEARLAKAPGDEQWGMLKDYTSQLLLSSGAASCENLVKLFVPQFEANPDDVDLMKNIQAFLIRNNCLDSNEEAFSLFAKVSEALYDKEPSAQAAAAMSRLYVRNGNYEKAMEYLTNALSEETVEENKADYYYQIAYIHANEYSNYIEAKKNIQEALRIRQWGDPYILLATLYAGYGKNCGENDFEKRTVYWVVVDKLIQARNIDSSVAEKANEMISQYSRFFPNKEDAFFYGVNSGDEVTVGCWIGERTRARF